MSDEELLNAIDEYGLTVSSHGNRVVIGHCHERARRRISMSCGYRDVYADSVRDGIAKWVSRFSQYTSKVSP